MLSSDELAFVYIGTTLKALPHVREGSESLVSKGRLGRVGRWWPGMLCSGVSDQNTLHHFKRPRAWPPAIRGLTPAGQTRVGQLGHSISYFQEKHKELCLQTCTCRTGRIPYAIIIVWSGDCVYVYTVLYIHRNVGCIVQHSCAVKHDTPGQ